MPTPEKIKRLMHQLGAALTFVADNIEDDGDRVYLGSTNHADTLRAARDLYDMYRFDNGDMGPHDALSSIEKYRTMQADANRKQSAEPK